MTVEASDNRGDRIYVGDETRSLCLEELEENSALDSVNGLEKTFTPRKPVKAPNDFAIAYQLHTWSKASNCSRYFKEATLDDTQHTLNLPWLDKVRLETVEGKFARSRGP